MTLPQTMKALALREGGFSGTAEGPSIKALEPYLEFSDLPLPVPGAGEVLIRVGLANVNPSDLHFIKGEYGLPRVKGAPAGFEGTGTVAAAGPGAEGLIGKRVAFVAGSSGAWAQYAIAEARSCVPVPDAIREEDAAALFVNPLTAIAMVGEVRKAGADAFFMTAAASQLCKLIAGLAKDEGLAAIAIVRRAEHVEVLKSHGAAEVLDSSAPDFKEAAAGLIKQRKPRILLDAVADQLASDLFFAMPSRSRWVIYGKLSPVSPVLTQAGQFIFMDKHIEGFWLSKWLKHAAPAEVAAAGAKVLQRFASGAWRTDVAEVLSLEEAFDRMPAALALANRGKVMLRP